MLLQVRNLAKKFHGEYIFTNVSFDVNEGEIFSLVGPSGIGKSTIGKIIIGITKPDDGNILFEGKDIKKRKIRDIQMIFQDPYSSLNEAMTVEEILSEPLIVNGEKNIDEKVTEMLKFLGMEEFRDKYPESLSGGQRQRIIVGAAMILKPKLVICDEPLSALDLSIQNQIVKLIKFFNDTYNTSFIFISHDLELVRCISDRIFNLKKGNNYNEKN